MDIGRDNLFVDEVSLCCARLSMPAVNSHEKRADMALVVRDPEPLLDYALKIDPAPPNDAVRLRVGTGLDDVGKFGLLLF